VLRNHSQVREAASFRDLSASGAGLRKDQDAGSAALTPDLPARLIDVRINIAERSALSCVSPAQHSAQSSVDNCYRDQAVTNARQLADLLRGADASVVRPNA
jgi:hypothetical protein